MTNICLATKNYSIYKTIYTHNNMFILIDVYLFIALLLIIVLLIVLLILKKCNNNITLYAFTEYFMYTLREAHVFKESDVASYLSKFERNRNIFNLNFDNLTWENDVDIFLQSCLISIYILSYVADETSIYYKDEAIWNALLFVHRLFHIKIKTDGEHFLKNSLQIHQIFTSFTVAMYLCGKNLSMSSGSGVLARDTREYLNYYKIRFYSDYATNHNIETFENYTRHIAICRKYIQQIDVVNKLKI